MRLLLPMILLATATTAAAGKKSDEKPDGIPLVVTVLDATTSQPVPFAMVRESSEKELHPVNRATGQFATTALYPSYHEELPLQRGMELVLEVTAAGYEPSRVNYTMRARKNKILVKLAKMDVQAVIGPEPIFQFARDRPIGGQDISAEELEKIEAEAAAKRKEREEGPE